MDAAAEFDAFYNASSRRVLHQMYAMTGNVADAQECTQEAFARAWQRWKTVSRADSPEAWVRTVAWRIAASRWRKAKNGITAMARHGEPESTAPPNPDHVALVTALRRIPEAQRRAIVLHHLVGMSVEEIAEEVGAATGTVKARLSRGRAALSELLTDESSTVTGGNGREQ
ncbi:SigE family RNA polymerase sigma factor [Actinobacteria bacterium YIM 96077]|uniref:SigE family RNA polymerase sigma factor n=1 Tax=Phytoactinopolyspora halophila TaxID=1981511 RepID=A0A329QGF8_9ACTN|nr:SigE family RNA polymerase sigma factor [Phytoactinopolyspora halophila]AYY14474.1 SigE family RNA polymerase sigma factor [Actinobacteria bacterium YIM 96077]RAW11467.1 SigE family RNA polymerase sigma factor [Phytoactinopolyspora halophila]